VLVVEDVITVATQVLRQVTIPCSRLREPKRLPIIVSDRGG
jgi:hypothetical protein